MKIETTEVSQKMVGIFCSADDKVPHEFKILAYELAKKLREKDLGIVTSASMLSVISNRSTSRYSPEFPLCIAKKIACSLW